MRRRVEKNEAIVPLNRLGDRLGWYFPEAFLMQIRVGGFPVLYSEDDSTYGNNLPLQYPWFPWLYLLSIQNE